MSTSFWITVGRPLIQYNDTGVGSGKKLADERKNCMFECGIVDGCENYRYSDFCHAMYIVFTAIKYLTLTLTTERNGKGGGVTIGSESGGCTPVIRNVTRERARDCRC